GRLLKAITGARGPCSTPWGATEAPATVGVPSVAESPPTPSTSPNWTISPGSPLIFSTFSRSSAATRYCFPPVLMTANIVLVLVFEFPELGGSGFFQSVKFQSVKDFDGAQRQPQDAYAGPAAPCQRGGGCWPFPWPGGSGRFRKRSSENRPEDSPKRIRPSGFAYAAPPCRRARRHLDARTGHTGADLSEQDCHPGGAVPGRRLDRLALPPAWPEARAA